MPNNTTIPTKEIHRSVKTSEGIFRPNDELTIKEKKQLADDAKCQFFTHAGRVYHIDAPYYFDNHMCLCADVIDDTHAPENECVPLVGSVPLLNVDPYLHLCLNGIRAEVIENEKEDYHEYKRPNRHKKAR